MTKPVDFTSSANLTTKNNIIDDDAEYKNIMQVIATELGLATTGDGQYLRIMNYNKKTGRQEWAAGITAKNLQEANIDYQKLTDVAVKKGNNLESKKSVFLSVGDLKALAQQGKISIKDLSTALSIKPLDSTSSSGNNPTWSNKDAQALHTDLVSKRSKVALTEAEREQLNTLIKSLNDKGGDVKLTADQSKLARKVLGYDSKMYDSAFKADVNFKDIPAALASPTSKSKLIETFNKNNKDEATQENFAALVDSGKIPDALLASIADPSNSEPINYSQAKTILKLLSKPERSAKELGFKEGTGITLDQMTKQIATLGSQSTLMETAKVIYKDDAAALKHFETLSNNEKFAKDNSKLLARLADGGDIRTEAEFNAVKEALGDKVKDRKDIKFERRVSMQELASSLGKEEKAEAKTETKKDRQFSMQGVKDILDGNGLNQGRHGFLWHSASENLYETLIGKKKDTISIFDADGMVDQRKLIDAMNAYLVDAKGKLRDGNAEAFFALGGNSRILDAEDLEKAARAIAEKQHDKAQIKAGNTVGLKVASVEENLAAIYKDVKVKADKPREGQSPETSRNFPRGRRPA